MFKLSSYRPYQMLTIVSHLAVVGLVRAILRRNGVGPWIASVAAGILLFLGTGASNIVQGWQVTFTLPLALGLAALVLGDHTGPWGRRDWFALCCLAVALASSAIGIVMLITVSVAMFLLRGARVGAAYFGPGALIFLGWYLIWGRLPGKVGPNPPRSYGGGVLWDAIKVLWHSLRGLGGLGDTVSVAVATALVVITVAGLIGIAFRLRSFASMSSAIALPIGLFAGAAALALMVTVSRSSLGNPAVFADRYVYILVVLLVPAIVIVAHVALADRHRLALIVVVIMCLGIPGNVRAFEHIGLGAGFTNQQRDLILSMAAQPGVSQLPDDALPFWMGPTAGWLAAGHREGWMPAPESPSPAVTANSHLRVSLMVSDPKGIHQSCGAAQTEFTVKLRRGEKFVIRHTGPVPKNLFSTGLQIEQLDAHQAVVTAATYPGSASQLVTSYVDDMTIRLTSTSRSKLRMC